MKTECVLNLLIEKKIIYTKYGKLNQLIRVRNEYDYMATDIIEKLIKSAEKNNDYFYYYINNCSYISTFVKKEDIKNFVKSLEKEVNRVKGIDGEVGKYIEKHYSHIKYKGNSYGAATFINLNKRNERLEKEEKKKREVLNILDEII